MDANRPVHPKQRNFVLGQSGTKWTRGTRIAEGAESQSNNATCHRPNEGQGSPFQADRRILAQTALGHPGQKTMREEREKP
ncbi:hypothetical protein KI387_042172, partial [Taxus chinensis]